MPEEEEGMSKECMQIGDKKICGIRSFILAFMIIATFCYTTIINNSIDQITSAAMLVIGFFFGMRINKQ